MANSQQYFAQLNEEMYNHWDCLPQAPENGIFQELLKAQANPDIAKSLLEGVDLMEDAQYWKMSRVFGEFVVLFDRPDGTIMVSKDLSAVYLVVNPNSPQPLGATFGQSVGWPNGANTAYFLHGPVLGAAVEINLINWQRRVINGSWSAAVVAAPAVLVRQALGAYMRAVDTNSLVVYLPRIPPPAKLQKEIPTSLSAIESFRNKHAVSVQEIITKPRSDNMFHSMYIMVSHNHSLAEIFPALPPLETNTLYMIGGDGG